MYIRTYVRDVKYRLIFGIVVLKFDGSISELKNGPVQ